MGRSKTGDMEYAKMLFLDRSQKLTIKEIAKRASVRPNTVSRWIEKYNWQKLRKSLMATRQKMIVDLYDQLELLNDHIKSRAITYEIPAHLLKGTKLKDKDGNETIHYPSYNEEDYPIKIGNFPTSKEANQIQVLTTSIKRLETETSISEIYEVSTGFLEYLKPQDFELYKQLIPIFDGFINSKMA